MNNFDFDILCIVSVILGFMLIMGIFICTRDNQPNNYCIIYAEEGTPVTLDNCDLIIKGNR